MARPKNDFGCYVIWSLRLIKNDKQIGTNFLIHKNILI